MRMIGHQRPGMYTCTGFQGNRPHPGHENVSIYIIDDDLFFFDPPDDHMMQGTRRIKSWTSRHDADNWLAGFINKANTYS
jgi:hypothetical protein